MSCIRGIAIKTRSGVPMQSICDAKITLHSGILGDFRGAQNDRQVTVLSESAWQAACAEIGVDLPWTMRRANLLIDGIEFDQAFIGKKIYIAAVELQITQETVPCSNMDVQQPGLTNALVRDWRGGVCCKVIKPGQIQLGDTVEFD